MINIESFKILWAKHNEPPDRQEHLEWCTLCSAIPGLLDRLIDAERNLDEANAALTKTQSALVEKAQIEVKLSIAADLLEKLLRVKEAAIIFHDRYKTWAQGPFPELDEALAACEEGGDE